MIVNKHRNCNQAYGSVNLINQQHSQNLKVHREITRSFYLKIDKPLHLSHAY